MVLTSSGIQLGCPLLCHPSKGARRLAYPDNLLFRKPVPFHSRQQPPIIRVFRDTGQHLGAKRFWGGLLDDLFLGIRM
jgi:hypothetical protein